MFYTLTYDEEYTDICQLSLEENGYLTNEEDVNEGIFELVLPADICGKTEFITNVDDTISYETTFHPEEPSTSKGNSNLM